MLRCLDRGDGVRLACEWIDGSDPVLMFLPGYMSDMSGTKASHLADWAQNRGRAFLRLDYSGTGRSEGRFSEGSIGRWAADAMALLESLAPGRPVIPIGSSMGGWIMLELARRLGSRLAGLVGIAPAPDFTRWGLRLDDEDRSRLAAQGYVERPSAYADQPYRYYRALLDDADERLMLERSLGWRVPVRIVHGMADEAVPWSVSLRLAETLESPDVRLMLVKDGDHRLSRPADLGLIAGLLEDWPC